MSMHDHHHNHQHAYPGNAGEAVPLVKDPVCGMDVDPRTAKLTTKDPAGAVPNNKCDADQKCV